MASVSRREFVRGTIAMIGALGIRCPAWAQENSGIAGVPSPHQLLLGVDYYPDQTPEALWEEDGQMMAEMGFTNVRIAEFAWALMEPAEGKFDFAWLHRVVQTLHKHAIAVILGTPSAAPPPWLTAHYPEIAEVNQRANCCIPADGDLPALRTRLTGGFHCPLRARWLVLLPTSQE